MKSFLVLVLTVAGSQIFAADANQFVGRFRPDKAHCQSGLKGMDRVYTKVGADPWGPKGTKSIQFQAYSDDARGYSVLLGTGKRQAPGTSVSIHGVVTQSWVTKIQGNTLVSVETTTRPSVNLKLWARNTLKADGKSLWLIQESSSNGGDIKKVSCKLLRY